MSETPGQVESTQGRQWTAAEVMSTPVVAVSLQHSLIEAWEAMRARRMHHVAVVDGTRIVGVLDDRAVAAAWPAGGPEAPHVRRVADVLASGVCCVLPEVSVTVVAQVMRRGGCDAVPVVDAGGQLVGLVTATDLVAVLAGEAM
jgi:CBS domain-containing protein